MPSMKKWTLKELFDLSPKIYGLIYLALIPLFAVLFYFFSESLGLKDSLVDSLYFSLATITTLGYGDITPTKDIGKIVVCFEPLMGIFIIGLFLNALSNKRNDYISELEQQREKLHKEELRKSLEMHACLIMESFKTGNPFSWDKHAKYSAPIDELEEFLRQAYIDIAKPKSENKINILQIKMLLESCDQNYDTLLALSPVAASISSKHLIEWSSLLSNVRNLKQQYRNALTKVDDQGKITSLPTSEDIIIQVQEYIETTLFLSKKEPINKN